jgi:hypothetical protein
MANGLRTRLVYVAAVAGLATVGGTAGTALAAPATLRVSPNSVVAGAVVQVSGNCEAHSSGFAISTAFRHDASHDFAGVGAVSFSTDASGAFSVSAQVPASIAPGTYSVGARCGGGNLGISASLTVTSHGGTPTGVPAGSGGQAATASPRSADSELLIGGLGLVLVAGGAAGALWLRRPVNA